MAANFKKGQRPAALAAVPEDEDIYNVTSLHSAQRQRLLEVIPLRSAARPKVELSTRLAIGRHTPHSSSTWQ